MKRYLQGREKVEPKKVDVVLIEPPDQRRDRKIAELETQVDQLFDKLGEVLKLMKSMGPCEDKTKKKSKKG